MSSPEAHSAQRLSGHYSFGDFTLHVRHRTLHRGGEEVRLRSRAFEVLAYLLDHHGQVVTKAALMEAVWPDTAVTDNSLAQCMVEIRRVLDDDAQRLIQTVARRGYVFAAPVTTPVIEPLLQPAILPVKPESPVLMPGRPTGTLRRLYILGGALALLAMAAGGLLLVRLNPVRREFTYTQLTNFTDSAVSPALSPDGRMLAFLRSDNWWLTPDQIWVKMLPDGEPVQVTHDPRPKYGLAFSPNGSQIAYTVVPWTAFIVSASGGEPRKVLSNSAGLTWLNERQLLFSEVSSGVHMGVVTATENRSEYRRIYFPQDERGMVHLSYASPDRRWALAVEMNPVWQPCRLIPLDGSSDGRQVGPKGHCTSAAWSPDGKWMYFGAEVEGNRHLWRQRFPVGEPEQITSGPTEEDGVAVAPDGRSLITSLGMRQSAIWIHDAGGERPLSSEGYVWHPETSHLSGSLPRFSRDGKLLFYLRSESPAAAVELWRADTESDRSTPVLRGVSILEFDISDDGKETVFSTQRPGRLSQLWLAGLEGRSPPRMLSDSGEDSPHFGPNGEILYRMADGSTHYLARMKRDGSGRSKVVPYAVGAIHSISPDRRWITTTARIGDNAGTLAIPVAGGAPRRICSGCPVVWAPDGKFLYLSLQKGSRTSFGKTRLVPLPPGEMLPKSTNPEGIVGLDDPAAFPGSRLIDGWQFSPGPDPSVFAYVKTTVHRNLFRIPLH